MSRRRKSKEELEELTRTQVLNLQELEKAANYEKKTSKKPAFVLAMIGVFSISLGLFYPSVTTMLSGRDADVPDTTISEQRQEDNEEISTNDTDMNLNILTCSISQADPNDVTLITTTTYTFQFLDNGFLGNYKKVMDIKTSVPVAQTPSNIVTLDTLLANLMQTPIAGYLIEKVPTASTDPNVVDGYTATLSVDFSQFDPATLTTLHTTNSFANVEFSNADTMDIIQQRETALGYTCQ